MAKKRQQITMPDGIHEAIKRIADENGVYGSDVYRVFSEFGIIMLRKYGWQSMNGTIVSQRGIIENETRQQTEVK